MPCRSCFSSNTVLLVCLLTTTLVVGQQQENDDNLRRIVKYRNRIGRELVQKLAKRIFHDFDTDNDDSTTTKLPYIVMEVQSKQDLSIFQFNPNIESIEIDSIWTADEAIVEETISSELNDHTLEQPFEEAEEQEEDYGNHHRMLESERLQTMKQRLRNNNNNNNNNPISLEQTTVPFGISMIQADQVSYNNGSNNGKVCIVDTGITIGHPLFNTKLIRGADRYSASNETNLLQWNTDAQGHGTHVAGIISARYNNANNQAANQPADFASIRGVGAGDIPLYITRGFDNAGKGFESDILEAMKQCESGDSKVISLSLSGGSISTLMQTYIDKIYTEKNIILVASSGNGGFAELRYPAAYPKVIAVGAVDKSETIWAGSNYGTHLELSAPGVGISNAGVTWLGEYIVKVMTGTSMAAPHVAGAVGILVSHYPSCTATQIRYALAYTAKDKGTMGCDDYYGYGIVQIQSALDFLSKHRCIGANWGKTVGNGTCSAIDVLPILNNPVPTPVKQPTPIIYVPIAPNPPTPTIVIRVPTIIIRPRPTPTTVFVPPSTSPPPNKETFLERLRKFLKRLGETFRDSDRE